MSTSPTGGRALAPAQVISMFLVFVLLASAGGILSAGFAMPLVGAASAITTASQELFEELPTDFNALKPSEVSVLYAADGQALAQFYAENRIVVSLDQISPNMRNAIVAVEDRRFYQHKGVDPAGMVRALVSNASGGTGDTQGASTLTQQYVRNVLVEAGVRSSDKNAIAAAKEASIARKLREVKYALTVEQTYSKDQILEGYLNIAAFGPSTYGVEASARHYFSHSAAEMSVPEAALLAGLTNAPGAYDPVAHPDKAQSRMEWVLKKMLAEQFITQEEYDAAAAINVADLLNVQDTVGGCGAASGSAAYFCEYVVGEIESSELFGATEAERHQLLLRGGLEIRTTLDPAKQNAAQQALEAFAPINDPSGVKTALTSVEPKTGRIVAMAQNTNYGEASDADPHATHVSFSADAKHGGLKHEDGTSGFQPGSTFKGFVLAQWYQSGHSSAQSFDTHPTTFPASAWNMPCAPQNVSPWQVKNVSSSLDGTHNVVDSTAQSINVAYARMTSMMNVCDVTGLAAKLGVTTNDGQPLATRPSIALGAQEVTPLQMASAYGAFGNHGVYCKPIAIDSITDADGNPMTVPSSDCTQAMDASAADQTAATLQYVITSGTGKKAALNGRPAAGKTGTTDRADNAWFVGFTPEQLSAAVWIGHSDGYRPISGRIGGVNYGEIHGSDNPTTIWKSYMDAALAGQPVTSISGSVSAPSGSSGDGGDDAGGEG